MSAIALCREARGYFRRELRLHWWRANGRFLIETFPCAHPFNAENDAEQAVTYRFSSLWYDPIGNSAYQLQRPVFNHLVYR